MVFMSFAIFLAVVLVVGSLAAYIKYRTVWDGINHIDVQADLHSKNRPPVDPNAQNLLVIGSDTRSGVNGKIGGTGGADAIDGARSDTIMVVHIAPGAHQIVVLSFPRDSVVPIYNCSPEDGTSGQNAEPSYDIEQINATFAYGGPGCLWETIEQTTGIHINDFIELTFDGFEQSINEIGGVEVCLPESVDDPVSGLDLTAGKHHIMGAEALAWWRTREDLGLGDDPQRIERDQFLMASLFQGIEHSSLLSSPTAMLRVIDTLTSHRDITTDSGLTPSVLLRLAEALRGVHGDSVQFVTVPWTTYTGNAQWLNSSESPTTGNVNWVQWIQPQANALFSAISHDTKLPTTSSKAAAAASASPSPSTTPVSPADVDVAVYNGTTRQGLASDTAASLTARGFNVVGSPADADTDTYTKSVVEYATAAQLSAAKTLAALFGSNVEVEQDAGLTGSTLHLIIGSTFTSLSSASSSSAISNLASAYNGITGNVNICDDSNAFAS